MDCFASLAMTPLRRRNSKTAVGNARALISQRECAQSRNGTLLRGKISLRRAHCLAKIKHAGCGAALLEASHMYRSSLTLAFCVLYSAAGAAATCRPSTSRQAESMRLPQTSCASGPNPSALRRTRLRISATLLRRGSCLPRPCRSLWRLRTALRRAADLVDRAPTYPERYYARERYSAQEYGYDYAPRPPLPVPYRSRARARCGDGYGGWAYCD